MSLTLGSLHDKIRKNPYLTKFEKDALIEKTRKDFSRGGSQIIPGYLEMFLPLIKAQDGKTELSDECLERIIYHIREKKNDFWLRLVISVLFTGEPIEETMSLTSPLLGRVTMEIRKKTPPLQLAWAQTLIGLRFQPGPVPFNVWDIAPVLLTNDIIATGLASDFLSRHFSVSERTVLRNYQSHLKDLARVAAKTPGSIIERQDLQIGPGQSGRKPSDPITEPIMKTARQNLEEKWGMMLGRYFNRPQEIFCQGGLPAQPIVERVPGPGPGDSAAAAVSAETSTRSRWAGKRIQKKDQGNQPFDFPGSETGACSGLILSEVLSLALKGVVRHRRSINKGGDHEPLHQD